MAVVTPAIQAWLDSRSEPIPLAAVVEPEGAASLQGLVKATPGLQGSLTEAMLWVRIGVLDPSHEIVQDGRNDFERYIHGIIHRLEGDFWNAKYWFRQVRNRALLGRIADRMGAFTESSDQFETARQLGLVTGGEFAPSLFVEACEALLGAHKKSSPNDYECVLTAVGQVEWQAVWSAVVEA